MATPVSILLPVYNAAEFLAQTLRSIVAQTHKEFEVIGIDDHSKDDSFEILQHFARNDERIIPLKLHNAGLAEKLNAGLRIAQNELVVRMDADDLMLPERLERQVQFMEQHPEFAVSTSYARLIDKNNKVVAESTPKVDVDQGIRKRNPAYFVELIHPACIMRKGAILSVGGYSEAIRFGEDRDLWGRLVTSGYRIGVQPEFLLHQRVHASSVSITRVRELEMICQYVNSNIVRRLEQKEELSFEKYLESRDQIGKFASLGRNCGERGMIWYKQATREYAEGDWVRFAGHALGAIAMNPLYALRMVQKIKY